VHGCLFKRMPLHRRLADQLRQEIARRRYPAGYRLAAETALAKRFGASVLTVREALRSLAQAGLVERRHGSGTYVLAPPTRRTVGVLLDHDIGLSHFSFSLRRIHQQVRRELAAAGYLARSYLGFKEFTAVARPDVTCPEFVEDVREGRLAGVAIVSGTLAPDLRDELRRQGVPVVGGDVAMAGRMESHLPALVGAGVRYLAEHGCRRLAMAGWGQHALFQAALAEHGLEYRPAWVRDDLHPAWSGAGWEEFREIWAGTEKPDGLLITDDVLSQDVTLAILEMGIRVPEDLRVASHANKGSDLRYPFPVELLTVDPDLRAHHLSAELMRLLRGEPAMEPAVSAGVSNGRDGRLQGDMQPAVSTSVSNGRDGRLQGDMEPAVSTDVSNGRDGRLQGMEPAVSAGVQEQ
jgi:DNA-binding LacI/PurR family transcriptional regulator